MSKWLLKTRWVWLPLLVLGLLSGGFLLSQKITHSPVPKAKASTTGDQIVAIAQSIQNGDLGTGRNPDACISTDPVECVQYSWGGGHGAKPGISMGSCANWQRPTKPAGAPLFSSSLCKSKSGPNGVMGLDCSGFTRWVYALAYNKDVLGSGTAQSQKHRAGMTEVPTNQVQPGDLVYFAKDKDHEDSISHVGIYAGNGMMINAPHTYDAPTATTNTWVPAFVREDTVASHGTLFSYYRYTQPAQPLPKLKSSYSGTAHNTTVNISCNYALASVKEDQDGNISGQSVVSLPLYGTGPFTGVVKADKTINYTATDTKDGFIITFTGTVNADGSLSGTYVANTGQQGTWSVK